jgi:hypothetical protein
MTDLSGPAAVPIPEPTTRKNAEERKELMARTLQGRIAAGGRVESQSDFQAVLTNGKKVNHVLHFLIGFITVGLWWLVWIALAITGGEKREMVTVDDYGNVAVQKL